MDDRWFAIFADPAGISETLTWSEVHHRVVAAGLDDDGLEALAYLIYIRYEIVRRP